MSTTTYRRIGDTEPLLLQLKAKDLTTLDGSSLRRVYFYKVGTATPHVNGINCPIDASGPTNISFDPVGNKNGGGDAFQEEGFFVGRVVVTMGDGDVNVYPQDARDDIRVIVRP